MWRERDDELNDGFAKIREQLHASEATHDSLLAALHGATSAIGARDSAATGRRAAGSGDGNGGGVGERQDRAFPLRLFRAECAPGADRQHLYANRQDAVLKYCLEYYEYLDAACRRTCSRVAGAPREHSRFSPGSQGLLPPPPPPLACNSSSCLWACAGNAAALRREHEQKIVHAVTHSVLMVAGLPCHRRRRTRCTSTAPASRPRVVRISGDP